MKIIVELDTSHKRAYENLEMENTCLRDLMKKNETEHTINMIDHSVCYNCDKSICNYTHCLSEEMGGGEEFIETQRDILNCEICKDQFCSECVDEYISDCDMRAICTDCNKIRKTTKEIRNIVLSMDNIK